MGRLNQRAFEILRAEVQRCCEVNIANQLVQEVALKRLERLRSQSGPPLTLEEMRKEVADLFPEFREKALKAAARANRPAGIWGKIQATTILVAGMAGAVWVLNLPYPMIRMPVARTAPLILLPSFMRMDHNYRQAIALVEQSDQLINQSTSPADIELGATKVQTAQKHLDELPVWFLGYYPRFYCAWFRCGWQFTMDEFQQARKEVARMDAKVFQEKNAQTALEQGEQALGEAQEQYRRSPAAADQNKAIADWQAAIDILDQIPPETLAGRLAKTKLAAYERDFQQVAGFAAGSARTGTLIAAAKQFANAAQADKKSARSMAEWEEVIELWDEAIARLQKVDENDPDYLEAQKLLAAYKRIQGNNRTRLQAEQFSARAYEAAQTMTNQLVSSTSSDPNRVDRNQVVGQLLRIEAELKKVQKGTTVYSDAQQLLKFAQNKLKPVR
jgi:tetratricopeptide (TPR) repeat protein